MGAESDLTVNDIRWLSPLPLWAGIVAGPGAWAVNLMANYALVKWVCATGTQWLLNTISAGALAIVCGGAALSGIALHHTASGLTTDGGQPLARVRFMAILGLALAFLFAVQIVAGAIPQWVLDACR